MAKFNSKKRIMRQEKIAAGVHPRVTRNYEDGLAYEFSDEKLKLFTIVATALMGEDKFYRQAHDADSDLIKQIHTVMHEDPKFILQLAAFSREKLYLRSVPLVLLGEAARNAALYMENDRNIIVDYTPRIIKRPDEILEVLAYVSAGSYFGDRGPRGVMLPNALRKGLEKAVHNFDEYQMVKYDRKGGAFTMTDAIRLIHPKPKDDDESVLFSYLAGKDIEEFAQDEIARAMPKFCARQRFLGKEKLDKEAVQLMQEAHATWEVAVSKFGNRREVWEAILPTMGYMAVLRNLRNMLEAGVDEEMLASMISDPERVRASKQLPFRFFSAARELSEIGVYVRMQEALAEALEAAALNVQLSDKKTCVAIDFSASMNKELSGRSTLSLKEVGIVMGSIAVKLTGGLVCIFGSTYNWVPLRPSDSILTNVERLKTLGDSVGHATNAYLTLESALQRKLYFDRFILVSDMQCYDSRYGISESIYGQLLEYRNRINPELVLISIDVDGYGTAQVPEDDPRSLIVAGWSENVFRLIEAWENSRDYMQEIQDTW
ncbi:MAG: TROVE domain-containing protein [Actinobacteria bacterium]|nr:TROVE domain-containing protein [Actinomycetota bacterium]